MTTVTGAPSASPYPKDLNEERETIRRSASEVQTLAGRIKSLVAAIDDALDDLTGEGVGKAGIQAIGRITDFNSLIEQQATDLTFTGEAIEAAELRGRTRHA